ncbi:MAG TPA: glycosyltransferase family 2 protein [Steroidobacteraceae bacterium]|nr:glycosyltransferase family 2 protein [Steroidobacteraceae bacterium]
MPFAPAAPAVAVVLVNWNSWENVIECLDSLVTQSHSNFHVFVVDNESHDGSVEQITQWCAAPRATPGWRSPAGVERGTQRSLIAPIVLRVVDRPEHPLPPPPAECRVTVVRSGANLGFAGGCNVGMRAAGLAAFEFFWLLNTDTVAHRDALRALTRRAQADATLGMVGSTLRYYDRPDIVQALGGSIMEPGTLTTRHIGTGARLDSLKIDPAEVERKLFYIFGASMLVSRQFVREIGLMQEDYFLYYEEIDWAMRGRRRFGLGYAPDSHIFHKSGASSSKVVSAFSTNLYYRNRIRFAARFFPDRLGTIRRGLWFELLFHFRHRNWVHARIVITVLWNAARIAAQVGKSDQGSAAYPEIGRPVSRPPGMG